MRQIIPTGILMDHLSPLIEKQHGEVKLISRNKYTEFSTFPVELIVFRSAEGKDIELFCKFFSGVEHNHFGHRGGVEYEVKIYSEILSHSRCSSIRYYGNCYIRETNETILILEYIGYSLRFHKSLDENAIAKAAVWSGSFHRENKNKFYPFIKKYDHDYYKMWSDRFYKFTKRFHQQLPWLKELINFYNENIDFIQSLTKTIIHGEYFPKNILLKENIIYPVDWESAAFAPGIIDLASLVEGWDENNFLKAKEAYIKCRWPDSKFDKAAFERSLLFGRLYFYFWEWEDHFDLLSEEETEIRNQLIDLSNKIKLLPQN